MGPKVPAVGDAGQRNQASDDMSYDRAPGSIDAPAEGSLAQSLADPAREEVCDAAPAREEIQGVLLLIVICLRIPAHPPNKV